MSTGGYLFSPILSDDVVKGHAFLYKTFKNHDLLIKVKGTGQLKKCAIRVSFLPSGNVVFPIRKAVR